MPSVAQNVGANRIVIGTAITHPLGFPGRPADEERQNRRQMVVRALNLLAQRVEDQTTVPGAA